MKRVAVLFLLAICIGGCSSAVENNNKNIELPSYLEGGSVSSQFTSSHSQEDESISVQDYYDVTELMNAFLYYVNAGSYNAPESVTDDELYNMANAAAKKLPDDLKATNTNCWRYVDAYTFYQHSPFWGASIEVIDSLFMQGNSNDSENGYMVTINVLETSNPKLTLGMQSWYVGLSVSTVESVTTLSPNIFYEFKKHQQMKNVGTVTTEAEQVERYMASASMVPFTSIEELNVDILTAYSIRSVKENDLSNQVYTFSIDDVKNAIQKTVGVVNTDITQSKYYNFQRDSTVAFNYEPTSFFYQGGQKYKLWHSLKEGDRTFLFADTYASHYGKSAVTPIATYCFAFDSSYEIPHLLWVKEVTDSNAASFYINEEIKIPQ